MNTDRNIAYAKDKFDTSRIGRMGLSPSLSMAKSTPAAIIPKVQAKAAPVQTVDARKVAPDMSVKSNAQSEAQGRAMRKAYEATYGKY